MAKNVRELDTPFRRGEKVITTSGLQDIDEGTKGKIQLSNGLGNWRRYWVRFEGGRTRGQVSHADLVRPDQLDAWKHREEERAAAALRSEDEAATAAAAVTEGDGGGGGGAASLIPAHLLERSKAAKARLLG